MEATCADRLGHWRSSFFSPKPTWVYFIQSGNDGLIKIGLSNDVDKRLESLQHHATDNLRLLHKSPGTRLEERAWHAAFSGCRHHGEWFIP